jgi:5-methylcytosine-specific restriction endonuclease McrA
MDKTCSVEGCGRGGPFRHGLCNRCRQRKAKHGTTDAPKPVTECPQGHLYDEDNTYIDPAGKRHCRICTRASSKASQERREWPLCSLGMIICGRNTKGGGKGYCTSHYKRNERYGDPLGGPDIRRWRVPMEEQIARRKAYGRDYQALHRERLLAKRRAWREANPELARALMRSRAAFWRATHPDAIRLPGVPAADRVDYAKILAEHGMVCHICQRDIDSWDNLHFDHVIPLARGGPHTEGNVRPSHALCNQRKHAKLMSELVAAC